MVPAKGRYSFSLMSFSSPCPEAGKGGRFVVILVHPDLSLALRGGISELPAEAAHRPEKQAQHDADED